MITLLILSIVLNLGALVAVAFLYQRHLRFEKNVYAFLTGAVTGAAAEIASIKKLCMMAGGFAILAGLISKMTGDDKGEKSP